MVDRRHQSDSNLSNIFTQGQSTSWETDDSTERINNDSDIDFVFDDLPSIGPLSTRLTKGKFKEPPPNFEFEDNSQNDTSSNDPDEEESEEGTSSDNQDNMPIFNFNLLQIDLKTFDDPIQFDKSQPHEWIILWLMKFQKQFNLPNTAFDTLVKFMRRVFHHYHIEDADTLPTSIFTAKSSLGFSTKYREYAMCSGCYTLYNPTDLKNYTEDDQPTVKKCHHVEFPLHQSKTRRLSCEKALTQEIVTQKGRLFRPISVYPVGSIKQQLYMMYQ